MGSSKQYSQEHEMGGRRGLSNVFGHLLCSLGNREVKKGGGLP